MTQYRKLDGTVADSPQLVEPGKGRKGTVPVPGVPETMRRVEVDLDLGSDHWLTWSVGSEGRVVGATILHKTPATETGWCEGAINVATEHYGSVQWEWNGDLDLPTFSPSLLCGCKDHGFVRDGRWITA